MPTAYLGLGANIASSAGPPEATLAAALKQIARFGRIVVCSSLYFTEPVGFADQPRFVNAVVELETPLAPRELLEALLNIELQFGRDRSAGLQNGPRTLDLDILLFGDFVLGEHNLLVPHPRMAERAFVLVPLSEIASDLRDPRSGATVSQLLERLFSLAEGEAHGVVRIESGVWLAGVGGGSGGTADARSADDHSDPR